MSLSEKGTYYPYDGLKLKKVLLVGTISNAAGKLERDLRKVVSALEHFDSISIFLVESDSSDDTPQLLEKLKCENSALNYVSLGNLRDKFPDRVSRLRYCRNVYVTFIRETFKNDSDLYICIADLDGMNPKITSMAVKTCFDAPHEWDVCFSNQLHGYSDLYALRCENWVSKDIFKELAHRQSLLELKFGNRFWFSLKLVNFFVQDFLRRKIIYQRMRKIPIQSGWIPVKSAFGGFAIYKSTLFLNADYGDPLDTSLFESEHVELHKQLLAKGSKMYINPGLINASWNTYNLNRYFLVRHIRELTRSNWFFLRLKNLVRH